MVEISFFTGTQAEVMFANGFTYPAANASSAAAQSLITGASGKFQQPFFPGGFFQQGRTGQVAKAEFTLTVTGQASATTAIITAGLNTAPNTISGGATLVAANAVTVTSLANMIWHGELLISCFGAGYGTSSVATNLSSTLDIRFNVPATTQPAASSGMTLGGPTALQTVDFTVNQWLYLTVTFNTSSATNSATLGQIVLLGLNLWALSRKRGDCAACFDQTDATNLLAAILNAVAYTTVTATHLRLGTSAPTATSAMTELAGGTGYTTGGSSIAWNAVSAAATSNSGTVAWTNSGTTWSLVGLEIWDTAGTPLRHLFGSWTGQPISVANGNTFQVAPAAVAVSLVL